MSTNSSSSNETNKNANNFGDNEERTQMPFEERTTIVQGQRVKVMHTVANLVRDILSHNEKSQYSQMLFVGGSGTGKTTCRQDVIHQLHSKHPYVIHYFNKKDIEHLSEILHKLEKGRDCILAFDDVSYTFQNMRPGQIAEILHQLTFVRHTVKARVIVMLSIHYSYGILKGLRQAAFRIITSATDEERDNYAKVFGYHNRKKIKMFINEYRRMLLTGWFRIQMPDGEPALFPTDKPFRLSLVSNIGQLHYMLYHKVDCNYCNEIPNRQPKPFDHNRFQHLIDKYGINATLRAARLYAFVAAGAKTLQWKDAYMYNVFRKMHMDYGFDPKKLSVLMTEAKKIPDGSRLGFFEMKFMNLDQLQEKNKNVEYENIPEKHFDKVDQEVAPIDDEDLKLEEMGEEGEVDINPNEEVPDEKPTPVQTEFENMFKDEIEFE